VLIHFKFEKQIQNNIAYSTWVSEECFKSGIYNTFIITSALSYLNTISDWLFVSYTAILPNLKGNWKLVNCKRKYFNEMIQYF